MTLQIRCYNVTEIIWKCLVCCEKTWQNLRYNLKSKDSTPADSHCNGSNEITYIISYWKQLQKTS